MAGTRRVIPPSCVNTKIMITLDNGDCESMSEEEYEALAKVTLAQGIDKKQEDQVLCEHDTNPTLVVTRVLTPNSNVDEEQKYNLFETRAGIDGKSISVIIDGGSCNNFASMELCDKLQLPLSKHSNPYQVQWLSDKDNFTIKHKVQVSFKIGPYEDTVECDVMPMKVCHMILGRPWQFDKGAIHDGRTNHYSFKWKDNVFVLRPMTPTCDNREHPPHDQYGIRPMTTRCDNRQHPPHDQYGGRREPHSEPVGDVSDNDEEELSP